MMCPNDPTPLAADLSSQPAQEMTGPTVVDPLLPTLDESYWRFAFEDDWQPVEEDSPVDPATVAHIERLLSSGEHSQQQIALQTDVDPAVIAALAERMRRGSLAGELDAAATSRCPRCGGRATTPCRVCQAREALEHQRQRRRWRKRLNGRP